MRHHNTNRKFGRKKGVRRAFLRSLSANLIMRGKIQPTEARAKELRKYVEPLVTRAKLGGLAAERLLRSRLATTALVLPKLRELGKKYAERPGGYTRVIKMARSRSDGSAMAVIEFV